MARTLQLGHEVPARYLDESTQKGGCRMQRSIGRGHLSTRQGQPPRLRLLIAAAATGMWSLALAGPASAQYVTPQPPLSGSATDSQTLTQVVAANPDVGAAAGPASVVRAGVQATAPSTSRGLPVTGGDVVGLTALGVGAIAAGTLLKRVRRRPSRT